MIYPLSDKHTFWKSGILLLNLMSPAFLKSTALLEKGCWRPGYRAGVSPE